MIINLEPATSNYIRNKVCIFKNTIQRYLCPRILIFLYKNYVFYLFKQNFGIPGRNAINIYRHGKMFFRNNLLTYMIYLTTIYRYFH